MTLWEANNIIVIGSRYFEEGNMNRKKLTILHSNDLHGDFFADRVDEKLVGGVSMLSGYVSKVRREEKNVIYAIAGDMFRGSIIDSEYHGISTIEIMNMISPDIVTIGNHETDYGVGQLLFLEKCAKFPIVNANLHIKTNNARLFKPCHIFNMDGMKILFIGILTNEVISQTKNDGMIGSLIDVEDAAEAVRKICNAYHSIDIDFTVLLTHIGFEEDKKLAEMLDPACGVDVIIGGHSHTFIDEPAIVNGIPIVQAGTGTDQVGRLDIIVDTDNNCIDAFEWKAVPIDSSHCPVDEEIRKLIFSYKDKTDVKYQRVVSRLKRRLTHPKREQETELGNLMADVMKESLGVDIFLFGSGAIRNTEIGTIIMYKDIAECFPYDDRVYEVEVTGGEFREMIRHMLREGVWQGEHCEFYQLSEGTEIVYDRKSREFKKFCLNGEPIEEERIYRIGLTKYHFSNFDEFFNVPIEKIKLHRKPKMVATSANDIIEEYLSSHNQLDREVEGRLTVI